ncbi:hypothetical protein DAPPUDRAFT_275060 [Daphnia pulex]|uniref:MULE transposase domain-containing protein n=1 Tax=Daphnia pulex TaxID=6669 RepID=E9I534_DAPPU|nr:hypothetical protein DAPPUDRAFT_275060 [Daphnia pulex]|eukprot:EFX60896.1 hypothetical protein DAPPUDRAFT_275060 [Daphnia pulex]
MYAGDYSAVNPKYSHGNSKRLEKTEKPYYRISKSVLLTAKERKDEAPAKVYGDIMEAAGTNMKKQAVLVPRDLEQVRNAQRAAREVTKISKDAQYNAYEVGIETNFMRKFEVFPDVKYACTHFGMVEEFEKLLNREDIPAIIVECDTTFNIGNYFVTWVTFRHTEFYDLPDNPMPTVGLACMIHTKKLQSSHEYFWNMLKDEIPSLQTAKNVLICTDEEKSIVNAIQKICI